jgi:hypothetical protein
MNDVLQCLSVRQPWAWAIVAGARNMENRPWTTNYRGPIVIQAGSSRTGTNQIASTGGTTLRPMRFAYGALIGVVELLDVVPMSESLESNSWAWGPYCWKFGGARKFHISIPSKGKLTLHPLSKGLSERARAAMAAPEVVRPDPIAETWIQLMKQFRQDERTRYGRLLNNYLGLGDWANALRLTERAVLQWGDAASYCDRCKAKRAGGDLAGALEDANRCIGMAPTSTTGYFLRSRVYADLSADDNAQANELGQNYDALYNESEKSEEEED